MSRIAKAAVILVGTGAVALSGAGVAVAGAGAEAAAVNSPGVISGNAVQVPIAIPINLCGNTIDIIGALNPAFGNQCANVQGKKDGGKDDGKGHDDGKGGYDDGKGHDNGYGG
ncbi:chaplin [Streptomyces sp. NPDC093595]|uniref:chaplin n=1 Tax=Streptomyces sp. NPDC093595 TaxID=3366045 RepID=UPI00380C3049